MPGGDAGDAAMGDGGSDGSIVPGTDSVSIGPFLLQPGDEENVCTSIELENATPMMVKAVRSNLTAGSHHLIALRTTGPEASDGCGTFAFANGVLTIAEKQGITEVNFPEGTGVRFEARQWIALEMHYVNYTDGPLEVLGTLEFEMVPLTETLEEVQFDFDGNLEFSLPANQERNVTYTYTPRQQGARIFAVTSHTHSLGLESTIHRLRRGQTPSEANLVHRSLDWSEPPLTLLDPPLVLESGEYLLLTCRFFNHTDQPVHFGQRFEDEMCFMWAHWY